MKKCNLLKIGVISILVLTVLISGCTSSSTLKTFSDGDMSFNYPGNFINLSSHGDNNSDSSILQVIGKLGNSNFLDMQQIEIGKSITNASAKEVRDKVVLNARNLSTAKVLSINTEINPNGITVEEYTYTIEDSHNGQLRFNEMFFEINNVVYAISVSGPDKNKQQIDNTTKIIFQSIK